MHRYLACRDPQKECDQERIERFHRRSLSNFKGKQSHPLR